MEYTTAMTVNDDHVKALLRQLVQEHGRPIRFTDKDSYEHPGEKDVSSYGWVDDDAEEHVRTSGCSWQIAGSAQLVERKYAQFTDTFNDPDEQLGINVSPACCTCGEYQDMHLRHEGSLGAILTELLNTDDGISI